MKNIKRYLITICVFLACQNISAALPDGIEVSIAPLKTNYLVSDSLLIKVTYRNASDGSIRMLKWGYRPRGQNYQ